MNWFVVFGWLVFGVIALGTVSTVLIVGQERKPLTPGVAAVNLVLNALVLVWIYSAITKF